MKNKDTTKRVCKMDMNSQQSSHENTCESNQKDYQMIESIQNDDFLTNISEN